MGFPIRTRQMEKSMSPNKAIVPKYSKDDAHIVRRLGAALVAKWDDLPQDLQEMLADQATMTFDKDETVQLRQQIDAFVSKYKGWPK